MASSAESTGPYDPLDVTGLWRILVSSVVKLLTPEQKGRKDKAGGIGQWYFQATDPTPHDP